MENPVKIQTENRNPVKKSDLRPCKWREADDNDNIHPNNNEAGNGWLHVLSEDGIYCVVEDINGQYRTVLTYRVKFLDRD